jgi:ankyrin repeat protein
MPIVDDLRFEFESAFIAKDQQKFNTLLNKNPAFCNLVTTVKGRFYYSLTHMAAAHGWLDSLEILVSQKAEVDLQVSTNNEPLICKKTPLHLAAEHGHFECVAFLLQECKVDPNRQDSWGKTPLFCALGNESEKIECVRVLLEDSRTNPNIAEDEDEDMDLEGDTPLHHSVKNNYSLCVRLLILAGASLTIKNKNESITPDKLATDKMQVVINNALKEQARKSKAIVVPTNIAEESESYQIKS